MTRRKDGRWQKRITLLDGTSKLLYSSAKSEREAIKDFNLQLQTLSEKAEKGKKLTEVLEEWKASHFETLQNNSLKSYKAASNDIEKFFEDFYIKDILPSDINDFISSLTNKAYALKTIKTRFMVLNLIFKFSIISQYTEKNPCQYITLPKNLSKTKREPASDEDIKKIKSNTDKPFGIFALFLLLTGCRRGEALALTPKDIDFEKSVVKITKTVEWIGSRPYIKNSPKTDAGVREIPLPYILLEKIKPLKNQHFLFQNSDGELMDNSQVTRAWNKYKKEIGISATPHQLRHSYQTMLFDANIDIKTAQSWLGHKDIKTTLDIYTHLSNARLEKSTKKLLSYVNKFF